MLIVPFFGQLRGRERHTWWMDHGINYFSKKNDFKFTPKKMSSRDLGFD
jgi:hypothetical protein